MRRVTIEMGPGWKMELLRDLLEEHGVPAFVADSNLKQIDPFVTGALALDVRLDVPEEALAEATAALAEARAEGQELLPRGEEEKTQRDLALQTLNDLGRRVRWATVLVWMHPFVFFYGWKYLGRMARSPTRPEAHALTLLALVGVLALWSFCLVMLLRAVM